MTTVFRIFAAILLPAALTAQQADTLKPKEAQPLREVLIRDQSGAESAAARLNNVENFGIYAGKKTEVVALQQLTANTATNNPRQIYGRITGLNIWESDGAGLQLGIGGRGLSPNRTANFNTRQNGYDISADALGYPESYYTPPTEALDRIEIVRGAASLQYGTQFGGLLNFRFKKGPQDKKIEFNTRQTLGAWNFFGSFNSVGGTVLKGKLNYYAYLNYKRGDGWRPNSGFEYRCVYGSAIYTPVEKLTLRLDLTEMQYLAQQAGGLTDKMFQDDPRQSVRARNWFSVDWKMAALSADVQFSEKTQLNIRNFGLLASRQSLGNLERINVIDFGGARTLIDGAFRNLGHESRLLHRFFWKGRPQTLLVGFRLYQGYSTARQGDGNNSAGPDFDFLHPDNLENSDYDFPNFNQAVFLEQVFNLGSRWSITPGLRFENIVTRSDGYFNQRVLDGAGNIVVENKVYDQQERCRRFLIGGLGITYKPGERVEAYGNFSQNYRAINFTDLRIVNPNFVVDSNLRDERGFTFDLGIRSKGPQLINYELTAFYVRYNGKIGQVLRADQPPLYNDYRLRANISDARNIGIESFAEADLLQLAGRTPAKTRLSLFVNAALVDARYVNTQDASVRNKKVEMAPPVLLRSGLTFRHGAWRAAFQYAWTAEHYSDATNTLRTATAVEGRIPAYQVADLSASYQWKRFSIEASCNNLFNTPYFTRRAESYPGPGIIPADGRGVYVTVGGRF